jgi:hypothetical protein
MKQVNDQHLEAFYQQELKEAIAVNKTTDREFAVTAVQHLYKKYLDRDAPEDIRFVASPEEALKQSNCSLSDILFMQYWSWWVSYYHYGVFELEAELEAGLKEDLTTYRNIQKNIHAVLACEEACFVIEYPTEIHIKDNDLDAFVLHNDGGLTLKYSDGTGFAWLNNIEVPAYVAVDDPSTLDVKKLMQEANTDVRREGFKRVGIKRIMQELGGKILDTVKGVEKWQDYELIELDLGDKVRRFLKMINPSTGDVLIERVKDDCSTVAQAHAFRHQEEEYQEPVVIT